MAKLPAAAAAAAPAAAAAAPATAATAAAPSHAAAAPAPAPAVAPVPDPAAAVRRVRGMAQTLWGNSFMQGLKVGLASYHFISGSGGAEQTAYVQ